MSVPNAPHAATPSSDAHAERSHSGAGLRTFLFVFGGLLLLTACSYLTFRLAADAPAIRWPLMMAISCVKALLVISFFMHLIWETRWKYVLTIPASIMSLLLIALLIPDIGLRSRKYSEERLRNAARPRVGNAGDEHGPAPHRPRPAVDPPR
ncbi:MAG: hypothetical protein FJ297_02615 [Planctomycetes bacterium]|nr:hypothetical protein [Planctomycetota bacterium]